jgi:hypothetical protein
MKLNCTIIQRREIELTPAYQQAFSSQAESFSSPTRAFNNFGVACVGVEEFHQINQDTFIWLLVEEMVIS